jgi:hypothetical protein
MTAIAFDDISSGTHLALDLQPITDLQGGVWLQKLGTFLICAIVDHRSSFVALSWVSS